MTAALDYDLAEETKKGNQFINFNIAIFGTWFMAVDEVVSFPNGGRVHLRTGLKLCTSKRQAGSETLTTRHLGY
jgi:hypothetical protein